jgi:hypothetical protein
MARLVVLSFDENEAAEKLVTRINNRMGVGSLNEAAIVMAYAHVEAVYAQPTKFCQCSGETLGLKGGGKKGHGWARSKKYGWWVHTAPGCSKPSRKWGSSVAAVIGGAYNLLPQILKRKEDNAEAETNIHGS